MTARKGMRQAGPGLLAFEGERRDEVEARRQEGHAAWAEGSREAFLEDVELMLSDGVTLERASQRLGITEGQLKRRLRGYGRRDLLDRFNPDRWENGPADLVDAAECAQHASVLLKQHGWTRAALARRAGITRSTLGLIVTGRQGTSRRDVAGRILRVQGPPSVLGVKPGEWNGTISDRRRAEQLAERAAS